MTKIAKYLLGAFALIGAIDFLGFVAWGVSGQFPPDDFFIGTITWHLIHDFWSVYPYLLVAWIFLSPFVVYFLLKSVAYKQTADVWGALAKGTRLFEIHSRIEDALFTDLTTRVQRLEGLTTKSKKPRVKGKRA